MNISMVKIDCKDIIHPYPLNKRAVVCSETYAKLRVAGEQAGKSLSSMDMLIAAHAHHLEMTLVTSDAAFSRIPNLVVEDWSR